MKISGKVWKFGHNLQGDYHIIPYPLVREMTDPHEMAKHVMANVDPEFSQKVKPGDILVAGESFGSGVCHPHAHMGMKALGISLVVADSVMRETSHIIHSLQEGLPVWAAPGISELVETGDTLDVDLAAGTATNTRTGQVLRSTPMGAPVLRRVEAGGMVPYIQQQMLKLAAAESDAERSADRRSQQ